MCFVEMNSISLLPSKPHEDSQDHYHHFINTLRNRDHLSYRNLFKEITQRRNGKRILSSDFQVWRWIIRTKVISRCVSRWACIIEYTWTGFWNYTEWTTSSTFLWIWGRHLFDMLISYYTLSFSNYNSFTFYPTRK